MIFTTSGRDLPRGTNLDPGLEVMLSRHRLNGHREIRRVLAAFPIFSPLPVPLSTAAWQDRYNRRALISLAPQKESLNRGRLLDPET
jgi:hypothetical protein